ncbi:MAG: OmpA family protein [Saprospiraceae bacterium]
MTFLIIFLCIVLTAVVLVQLGKVTEIARSIRGEADAQEDLNTRQGIFGVIFLVLFLFISLASAMYYKNWMLGYGPHASASIHGDSIDGMFNITLAFTYIVFVLTHIALFWYAWKYRGRRGRKALFMPHDTKLELVWTAIPAIVMCFLVVNGLIAWNEVMGDDGDEDIEIEATAHQFSWTIRYPGQDGKIGTKNYKMITGLNSLGQDWTDDKNLDDIVADKIVLPVGKKVRVRITAKDVLHNFAMPHFRVKMDAVPGLPTYFYFTPKITTKDYRKDLSKYPEYQAQDPNNPDLQLWETFNFALNCAELCGSGHYAMKKVVEIVSEEEYEKWLSQQKSNYFTSGVRFSDEDPYKDQLFDAEYAARSAEFKTNFESTLIAEDKTIILDKVEFETGKASLTALSKYQIMNLAEQLRSKPNVMIELAGHTDSQGAELPNLTLSDARANTVYNYLVRNENIDASRLTAVGYGEDQPIGDNDTDAGRQKNRRTEARIIAQ